MATKVQKNFRKEMKKYALQQQKNKTNRPISYIHKETYDDDVNRRSGWQTFASWIPRLLMIIFLIAVTGIGSHFTMVIQELLPNSTLHTQQYLMTYLSASEGYLMKVNDYTEQANQGLMFDEHYPLMIEELEQALTFTQEEKLKSVIRLNGLFKEFHQTFLTLMTSTIETYQDQLIHLDYQMELKTLHYQIFQEIVQVLEDARFKYEIMSDESIYYEMTVPTRR